MFTYLKPILVLLVSILIFAGAAWLVDNELVDFIQTHFYNPSVISSYTKENAKDAELAQSHILELQNKFAHTLNEPAVRSSFLYNQSPEDIYERSRLFGILLESTAGLQSVQFVDTNGIRIHYSTAASDILNQDEGSTSYRNYTEDPLALPYDLVSVSASDRPKFTMDEKSDRIIYSFPFIDSMDVYRGTAVFTVSIRALAERLVAEGRLKVSDDVLVIGSPQGVLFGSPGIPKADFLGKISSAWNSGLQGRVVLDAEDSGVRFSLISFKTDNGIFFGRLINDSMFYISDSMKMILYLSMFLTFYLTLYFLTNFKPNSVTVVKNRIRRLRESLFEQLYVNKTGQERAKWILELEQRRYEIHSELKRNLKMTRRSEKNIDTLIDHSWDELLAIMKTGSYVTVAETEKITETRPEGLGEAEEIEELSEIEEVEALEESEEIEELGEIEEVEALEEPEDIEELGETEEAEVLEEPEDIEELGEIEEAEDLEEAEEIEELGEIEEAEVLEEPEEIGELGAAEALEEIDDLPDINEPEEIKEVIEEKKPQESDELEEPPVPAKKKRGRKKTKKEPAPQPIPEPESKPKPAAAKSRRGLLAVASEIEFNRDIPVGTSEEDEDISAQLDIVSPFSSMFTSLDDEED